VNPLAIGLLYGGATLVILFAGVPIAFALGAVAVAFMIGFMPFASLGTVAQNVYQEIANITLLTIPLFILKGAAIGRAPAPISTMRFTFGSIACPADSASPTWSPALYSRLWRDRARPPVRQSAAPAFRKCAGVVTPRASPPASSPPEARSASCCRRRSQ
jgi:hypothetical protein